MTYGYPDILVARDLESDEFLVYEVKPYSKYGKISGLAQMARYTAGEGYTAGPDIPPSITTYKGTVITYGSMPGYKGIVFYHTTDMKLQEPN